MSSDITEVVASAVDHWFGLRCG